MRSRLCGNRGPTYVRANSAASSRVRTVTSRARRSGGSNTKSLMPVKLVRHNRGSGAWCRCVYRKPLMVPENSIRGIRAVRRCPRKLIYILYSPHSRGHAMGYETINVAPVTPRIGAEVDGLTLPKPDANQRGPARADPADKR